MTGPRRWSLLLILGTDLSAVIAALAILPTITVIVGLPLTLLAPGAALLLAVDPYSRQARGAQRLMWIVAASLGTVIMGGLLLNLAGGLTRTHWLVLITVDVLVLSVVGWFRGAPQAAVADASDDVLPPTQSDAVPGDTGSQASAPARKVLTVRQAILLVVTLLVVTGALLLSLRTAAFASRETFVSAWIVTEPVNHPWSTTAQVGVMNHQGHRSRLVVEEVIGRSAPQRQTITLDNGQTWRFEVRRNGGEPVSVTVLSSAHAKRPLASVRLAKPVPAGHRTTSTTSTTKPAATTNPTTGTAPH